MIRTLILVLCFIISSVFSFLIYKETSLNDYEDVVRFNDNLRNRKKEDYRVNEKEEIKKYVIRDATHRAFIMAIIITIALSVSLS